MQPPLSLVRGFNRNALPKCGLWSWYVYEKLEAVLFALRRKPELPPRRTAEYLNAVSLFRIQFAPFDHLTAWGSR